VRQGCGVHVRVYVVGVGGGRDGDHLVNDVIVNSPGVLGPRAAACVHVCVCVCACACVCVCVCVCVLFRAVTPSQVLAMSALLLYSVSFHKALSLRQRICQPYCSCPHRARTNSMLSRWSKHILSPSSALPGNNVRPPFSSSLSSPILSCKLAASALYE
jgi:hypothetical protein